MYSLALRFHVFLQKNIWQVENVKILCTSSLVLITSNANQLHLSRSCNRKVAGYKLHQLSIFNLNAHRNIYKAVNALKSFAMSTQKNLSTHRNRNMPSDHIQWNSTGIPRRRRHILDRLLGYMGPHRRTFVYAVPCILYVAKKWSPLRLDTYVYRIFISTVSPFSTVISPADGLEFDAALARRLLAMLHVLQRLSIIYWLL